MEKVFRNVKRKIDEFEDVQLILDAKVPLVRFFDRVINKKIDLAYGPTSNTELKFYQKYSQ